MTEENQNRNVRLPAMILAPVFCALVLFSFLKTDFVFSLAGKTIELRPVDLFADLKPSTDSKSIAKSRPKTAADVMKGFIDRDTLSKKKGFVELADYGVGTFGMMENFFDALSKIKIQKRKVHIAYYGDSLIEGDILLQDLRERLQKIFGGRGVGFMPITSITAGFRQTITHHASGNWKKYSIKEDSKLKIPLGYIGETFVPAPVGGASDSSGASGSWVEYSPTNHKPGLDKFYNITLYYSAATEGDYISFTTDKTHYKKLALKPGNACQSLQLNEAKTPATILRVRFYCQGTTYFYGVNFDDETGVYIDNLSMRGSSGQPLTAISSNIIQAMAKNMNTKLCVMQFGINADPNATKHTSYMNGMEKVVDHFKECFSDATILISSVSDRARNNAGTFKTYEGIRALAVSQEELAKKEKVVFYPLLDAMVSDGGIASYVSASPPMANKDYTHLNWRGGEHVADLIYYSFYYGYKKFLWLRDHKNL